MLPVAFVRFLFENACKYREGCNESPETIFDALLSPVFPGMARIYRAQTVHGKS